MSSITTVTLFRYTGLANRWWAFTQMGLAGRTFNQIPGLAFGRLMGSGGGNGFSLKPDWGTYAFLGCWTDRKAAEDYFASGAWWQLAAQHCAEQITFYLAPTIAHGAWNGVQPFTVATDYNPAAPTAVLTRATIRTRKLPEFWRWVPATSASVDEQPDRLLSLGVGEYPIFMQATFSLWRTGKAMQHFAYRSKYHKEVVRLTRERNWYKEELFARFTVVDVQGDWSGLSDRTDFLD